MNLHSHDFRPNEEVLENIRKGQELMRDPEGIDLKECIRRAIEALRTSNGQIIVFSILRDLMNISHPEYGFWQRVRLSRKELHEVIKHIKECDECQKTIEGSLRQLEVYRRQP